MLITDEDAKRIAAGEITAIIRKWKRPQSKAGGVYQTMRGWILVSSVDVCPLSAVSTTDLAAADVASVTDLERFGVEPDDEVHVVRFSPTEAPDRPDPGANADLTADDVADLRTRLARMDDRANEPWTAAVLEHIAAAPGTRSADMAAALDCDQAQLKTDVRKLKRLGLTRSLERGYELSPRGQALLDHGTTFESS